MSRISTSSTGGNVNIQDTNGNPLNSTSGALDVNIVSSVSSGTTLSQYNEVTNVAIGSSTTVLTYTVPAASTLNLTRIDFSSDSVALVEVEFNSAINAKRRIYYTDFNTRFEYNNTQGGYQLAAGTVVTVVATNNSLNSVASFNATLQGIVNV